MNLKFKLTTLTIICLLTSVHTEFQHLETPESAMNRVKWIKDQTATITHNKLDFDYSEQKGTHCIAKDNIKKYELIMNVPKEYLVCACK
jgi:hypothetical protein